MPTIEELFRLIEYKEHHSYLNNRIAFVSWYGSVDEGLSVYIRIGKQFRYDTREFVKCITVANVTALKRGEGTFTRFLDKLESLVDCPIYVEQIQNARLDAFLDRRGYVLLMPIDQVMRYGGSHRIKIIGDTAND